MRICRLVILTILVILFAAGCAVNVPLSTDYFQSEKRVGIILIKNDITTFKEGSQGALDHLLTLGNKYREPLEIVDKEINPNIIISELYQEIFKSNSKQLQTIDESINFKNLEKFQKPESEKIFHKYDLRYLKPKLEIDELLLVNVNYGLIINYYSIIEIGRMGYCKISSEIINLDDNSIIYKNQSISKETMKGKWKTPPLYENLKNTIKKAIDNSIQQEKSKY